MRPRAEEIEAYAQAVRDALADVPEADRAELLEDLEDHLAEVSEESGEALTTRLGTPEHYAAELRTAYGADAGRGRRRSPQAVAIEALDRTEAWLRQKEQDGTAFRAAWAFIQELRPVWWLLRAYFVAVLVWRVLENDWYRYPQNFIGWVVLVGLVVGSVALGMWSRTRASGARRTALIGNLLVIAFIVAVPQLTDDDILPMPSNTANSVGSETAYPSSGDGGIGMTGIVNIQPFSKDGKPLKDVLLYDQDGRPIQTDYAAQGLELRRCDGTPPISNSYPLPLQSPPPDSDPGYDENGNPLPSPAPSPSCAPGSPAPAPSGSPSKSPAPSPSGSPSASPSASPSVSPSPTHTP
jgi:hypothetical protein